MKPPSLGVHLLPLQRERRHEFQVLAASDQGLVDLAEPRQREGFGERMRIERGGVDPIGISECLRVSLCDPKRNSQEQPHEACHTSPFLNAIVATNSTREDIDLQLSLFSQKFTREFAVP